MSRTPAKERQAPGYKLRMPDSLREQIDQAAAANHTSANREIINRLHQSFVNTGVGKGEDVFQDIAVNWARFGKLFHDLASHGDLVRAAELLVEAVEKKGNVKDAIQRVNNAIAVIDHDAALIKRRFSHKP